MRFPDSTKIMDDIMDGYTLFVTNVNIVIGQESIGVDG